MAELPQVAICSPQQNTKKKKRLTVKYFFICDDVHNGSELFKIFIQGDS